LNANPSITGLLTAFLFTRRKRNMNIRQLESFPRETRRMFLNLPCPAHL
jgi:hypothetical protein